jgi:alkylated DNA repair dioxygenase AlkB
MLSPTYIPSSSYARVVMDNIYREVLNLDWLTQRSARKEYFMSDKPRTYSYGNKYDGDVEYTSKPFSPLVEWLMVYMLNHNGKEFNVCFLNRYENEQQHLGWHSDEFPGMRADQPITVLSVGAEREIWWKEKGYKGNIPDENKQLLEHGSLWTMPVGFQDLYLHKIPKHDQPCGVRISLTFRSFE